MPARALGKLIERLHPDRSVRQIERDGGLVPDRIAHWLKPGTEVNRIPPPGAIREIARALGCRVAEVVYAFNSSLDDPLPWGEEVEVDPDEALLVGRFRALPPTDRESLLRISETFAVHAGVEAPPVPPADLAEHRRRRVVGE